VPDLLNKAFIRVHLRLSVDNAFFFKGQLLAVLGRQVENFAGRLCGVSDTL